MIRIWKSHFLLSDHQVICLTFMPVFQSNIGLDPLDPDTQFSRLPNLVYQSSKPVDGIILGDRACQLLTWLMTPFLAATTPAQAHHSTLLIAKQGVQLSFKWSSEETLCMP